MNFKPFYVKTENLNLSGLANLREITQNNGANLFSTGFEEDLRYTYVGVDYVNDFIACDDPNLFSADVYVDEAIELTYEEALLHVQGKDDKYRILEGESEDFFPVSDIDTKELDKILMMDTISLRLPESMIKDLIEATEGKISYKTLIRKLIKEYLDKGDK